METSSRRLYLAGSAILILLMGFLTACRTASPTSGLHRIKVLPGNPPESGPTVLPDPETIHVGTQDIASWYADRGTIGILFKATDFDPNSSSNALKEPPFIGGQPGVDQPINCFQTSCTSLNVNPVLVSYLTEHRTAKFTYKYWQSLDGNPKDGRIIIKW